MFRSFTSLNAVESLPIHKFGTQIRRMKDSERGAERSTQKTPTPCPIRTTALVVAAESTRSTTTKTAASMTRVTKVSAAVDGLRRWGCWWACTRKAAFDFTISVYVAPRTTGRRSWVSYAIRESRKTRLLCKTYMRNGSSSRTPCIIVVANCLVE